MGKTFEQITWAEHVARHTSGKVIILAPLAVAPQTVTEGKKFGVEVKYCLDQSEVGESNIIITNYERLDKFDTTVFTGVVLDESSILKSFTGKTKRGIIEAFKNTPFKLACTATPAPNDHMELGNHAEFLDVMPSNEMLSRWFINDTMGAGDYRLKHHAEKDFWRWVTSWAVCISKPSDLGEQYAMDGFDLPTLHLEEHYLAANQETIERAWSEGRLMPDTRPSSTQLHRVKRESLDDRVAKAREIANGIGDTEAIVLWCDTNYEADALKAAFPEAIEVRGNHSIKLKEERLTAFSNGSARVIITKPDIAGFGLNWQHCSHQVFVGVSYSFEKTYQALRRSYRFGQKKEVHAHIIYAETEGNVIQTLKDKQEAFNVMQSEMNAAMTEHGLFRTGNRMELTTPPQDIKQGKNWTMYLGDCVEQIKKVADNSVHFGISSPPFSNLYIYSDSEADMGNAQDDKEFFIHYRYLIAELYRTTVPGRLCAVHCKDLPMYMNRDDAAGLKDFPGMIIRAFEEFDKPQLDDFTDLAAYRKALSGWEAAPPKWQYHSRVTIWKDPVIEMQRTKNHGLLHKNFTERAEACRQGMPDYLIVFRKWGIEGGTEIKQSRELGDYIGTKPPTEAEIHPTGKRSREDKYSIAVWQKYASPVWYDIDQTKVLNFQLAKSDKDEKHICPLQLDVIARSIDLWSAKGETVLSPFAGVGSEGYEALRLDRKFIGIELKPEYFEHACKYLNEMELSKAQLSMFDLLPDESAEKVS